ncbi:hypothetical protein KY327_01120 [Candidatus Woesearchaeota archaeon]|nr:hypothetical protein [Candidatus Woesearchaeota archaeon]
MRFSERVGRMLQSFLPQRYRNLTAAPVKDVMRTATTAFLLILLLSVLSAVPRIVEMPDRLAERAAPLSEANFSANLSVTEPVVLNERPLVVVETDKENLTDERVLFNEEGVQLRQPFRQGVMRTSWDALDDPSGLVRQHRGALVTLAFLLLPSAAIALGLAGAAVTVALVLVTFLLGRLVTKLARFRIRTKPFLKVCVIASTPFAALLLLPFFYFKWFLVPVAAYLLLVFLGTWLVGEGRHEHKPSSKKEDS